MTLIPVTVTSGIGVSKGLRFHLCPPPQILGRFERLLTLASHEPFGFYPADDTEAAYQVMR